MSEIPNYPSSSIGTTIRRLVGEIDGYLATLGGPGIADVRTGIAAAEWGTVQSVEKHSNQIVSTHLSPALRCLSVTHASLASAIAGASPWLNWTTYNGYATETIGEAFASGHAYASLVGDHALGRTTDYSLGLFLIAPNVLYRDHSHPAPELYAPLTGPHAWRFGPREGMRIIGAHQPIWNTPNTPHLTKVGRMPFLSIYAWTKDVSLPAVVHYADDWAALEEVRME